MIAGLILLALTQQRPAAADTAGRPCVVAIDSVGGKTRRVVVRAGEENIFAGGGVLAHCEGAGSSLSADSVAWYSGVGRFDMIGQKNPVHIRDTALTLDATTASYFLHQERLEAHRNVVATNRSTGSVLRGPNLTYYRAVQGVRDTTEMYATSRPTIDYRSSSDSGEPYVIVADRVRLKGNDRMWGGGRVTIDRSDFAARGDSMQLDQATGFGVLLGKPRVEGKGTRPYALTGTRIELALTGREVRAVKALGKGVATGSDWRLTADTIHLMLERRKLQHAFAWERADSGRAADSSRARAVSTLNTIDADSLALDLPDEVLSEARAFRRALATSKDTSASRKHAAPDTSATASVNWIAGDTLTAHWNQVPDSAGQAKTKLRRLVSRGSARSFTHLYNEKDTTNTGPSLNYSRGQQIDIVLKADRVDSVLVTGRADGVQLEPLPPKPPADSTAADSTKTALKTATKARRKP